MDPVLPTPTAIPEGCCVFCDSSSQSVERYGKFLHHEESGIYAHYYCMLFACGLSQRGKAHEGIEGFLIKDILAERKRAQKLKCKYCKKKGASVGCSVKACHQIYHYGCGVDEEAIFLFYDSFVSYCVKHRPVQKVLPSDCSPIKGTCPICMEHVETTPSNSVLKTPCCKGTWLHRDCVQMQALSAGYFFRCAICNNENEFQDEMKKFGIYLPEKDADWEFGVEAYQELYERHNRCDVDKCRCPRGRKYFTQSGQWEIVLCDLCGSAGCHVSCGGLVTALDDWACKDCTSTFTRGFLEQNPPTEGRGTVKSTSSSGSQQKRTPGQGGTRVRSAIRSQGKRPRPPPTTPRPLKKMKQSSTPICPPLSPVSSQQSSLSSSPKSTPCPTMKFPKVSLSPTYEREDSGPGSSRESFAGKYRELLPKLECYVALEPPSRDIYCPNLSMPSLSPAASSAKKPKSSNKLKCKKARKLDLNSCNLPTEIRMGQTSSSKRQGYVLPSSKNVTTPALISSPSDKGKESTVKLSWGSRLLDSVGSFLWRKSPSKARTSESSEVHQERKATVIDSNDIEKSLRSQKQHTHIPSLPLSSLESPESLPKSTSPIALSEEVKAQILPVTTESVSKKTKNRLHDLTSWKDDTTWKEAKQDLAHLFQFDGRATRNALKKDGKTSVKTSRQERKASCINSDDIAPKASLRKDQPSSVQSTLPKSLDHVCSHQKYDSPVLSEEVKAQINPLNSESVPSKTKNLLNDLTSWKDDSTWKEAKQDLAHLFQVNGRATRSAVKKDGKTPVKASGQDKKVICVDKDAISQKPPLQKEQPPESQGSLSSCLEHHGHSHQASNSPVVLSEKIKAKIIPLTSKSVPSKTKNLLQDLTSWKDDSTWKEAKQDLAQLFQVDGRATRSALKKDGKTPVKTLEKERKASCIHSEDIAEKSPVFPKTISDVQCSLSTNLESFDSPKDASTPVALSKVVDAHMVSLPTESLSRQAKNLLNDLTSWKDDTTWKEAKQDLIHLYQVDCRATRNALKKGGTQLANRTSLCSPAKKKRKLEYNHSPSPSTFSPVCQSGKTLNRIRNPCNGRCVSKKGSYNEINPEKVVTCNLPSSNSPFTKESDQSNDSKQISEAQGQCLHSGVEKAADTCMPILPATVTKELRALTSWKDDVTWKEAKGDLANLFQVDGRTTRSILRKDKDPESSLMTKENTTTFEVPDISVLTPLKKSEQLNQKQDVSIEIGCKEFGEVQENEANSSVASIPQITESSKAQTDETKSLLESSSTPGKGKKGALDLRKLTAWKDDQTWKEFRGDMAVLLQIDGRTTRNKAQRDGLKGICGSPKVVGKETMLSSIKKGQALSSMPVLKKIMPDEKEICSPNQKLLVERNSSLPSNGTHILAVMGTGEECCEDLNVSSKTEKPFSDALLHVPRSSNEIKDSATYATCSDSKCDIRKEPVKEKRKSRKSLSKVFSLNHHAEDKSSKGKSEKYKDDMTPCHDGTLPDEMTDNGSMDSRKVTSDLDDPLSKQEEITSNAEVCVNHGTISSELVSCYGENETPSSLLDSTEIESSVQNVRKYVLHDRSSQTTASTEEVKAYVTSLGMHYKPPCYPPPTLTRQDGNCRTRCTQTYNMKYENHHSFCTPSSVQSFANEENHFNEELTEMPELSDGEITPQKNNCLSKRSEKAKDPVAVTKQTIGMRRTHSCKKSSLRRGNSCSSPLPHAAVSPKILPLKKKRHASEPPVLTPLESLSVKDDQDDLMPNSKKLNSQDVITDAGNSKQSCVSHSDQIEKVEESGKSSVNEVQTGAIKQPKCHGKRTQLVHQHSFSGNGVCKEASGDLDQRLQTDERHISCQKKQPSALNIADDTLPTRVSSKKKHSNSCSHSCSRCVVPSQENSSEGQIKQHCHFPKRKPNVEEHTDCPTTSQISKKPSSTTIAPLIKEDVPAGCKSSEPIFEATEICRSLVDEVLKNALIQSKCRVKRTQWELLESWTKDGLWKEAKDDVNTLLHAEERITRSSRKDHNESKSMHLSEGPSLAKEKMEPFSSTNIVKPSPSLDLRKRKYCCSHMRSPWKASPAKSKSIAHEISTKPKEPQQVSPVFRKLSRYTTDEKFGGGKACASPSHDSKRLKISPDGNGTKPNVNTTPASVKKVWKPTVHPSAKPDKQDSRSDRSWSSSKKLGMPRLHTEATRKEEANEKFQECTAKKVGRPRKEVVDIAEAEKSSSPREQLRDNSEMKKKIGRPRKEDVDIAEAEKSSSPREQLRDNSEMKKKIGRPRKEVVDIAESENSGSPRKQIVDNSVVKKKLGRPRKEVVDIAESGNSGSPRKQLVDNSVVKKKLGRPRKEVVDIAKSGNSGSPRKQLVDTSEMKKTVGRPKKQAVDIDESEKSCSPRKKLVDNSDVKKKLGRPRKHPGYITEQEMSGSPPKQLLHNSENKKRGRPRNHSVDIPEEKLDCGETSKSSENGKFSGVQQSCQGIVSNSRNIRKARRRLESSTTELSVAKGDDDLAICFIALQEVLQAGKIKTKISSTQTDATVEEVEAYVASKGKLYLEPCYTMPRPHLDRTEATSDMRTQTYNLELSQCLQNETKRTCPPLVFDKREAKGPPSSLKKIRSKRKAKRPPTLCKHKATHSKRKAKRPPTLDKVSSSNISPMIPATLSPIKSSIPYVARTDCSSQTDLPMEEVEAHIKSMGEWYREPSIIVTGSQEGRGEVKNSVRTQTYNMNLPERELPMFKKKFSKRVQNQMKSTQTLATWEEVKAYIEANKQVYIDPKYFTTQSYFLVGSSLNRHIATQTYSFSQDEVITEDYLKKEEHTKSKDIKGKGNPESQQTSAQDAVENAHYSSRELLEPVERDVMEDVQKIDTQTHQCVESNQSLSKQCAADCKVPGNGVSKKVKTDSITSGLVSKNWFRLKPKK